MKHFKIGEENADNYTIKFRFECITCGKVGPWESRENDAEQDGWNHTSKPENDDHNITVVTLQSTQRVLRKPI